MNLQNCVHSLKICVHFSKKKLCCEYTKSWWFFEKLCTLNILNCVHSLKDCVCWEYKIVYILQKIVYIKYTELCVFFGSLDIECTYLRVLVICEGNCPHLKKMCTLNIRNHVHSSNVRTLNIQICVYFLKAWVLNVQILHY